MAVTRLTSPLLAVLLLAGCDAVPKANDNVMVEPPATLESNDTPFNDQAPLVAAEQNATAPAPLPATPPPAKPRPRVEAAPTPDTSTITSGTRATATFRYGRRGDEDAPPDDAEATDPSDPGPTPSPTSRWRQPHRVPDDRVR